MKNLGRNVTGRAADGDRLFSGTTVDGHGKTKVDYDHISLGVGDHQVRRVYVQMDNILGMDGGKASQDLAHGLADRAEVLVDGMDIKGLEHGQDQNGVAIVVDERILELDDMGQLTETMEEFELFLGKTGDGDGLEGQGHEVGNADTKLDRGQVVL